MHRSVAPGVGWVEPTYEFEQLVALLLTMQPL